MTQRLSRVQRPPGSGVAIIVTAALGTVIGLAYDSGLNAVAYVIATTAIGWLIWLLLWQMAKTSRER